MQVHAALMEVPEEQRASVLRAVCVDQGIPLAATTVKQDEDLDDRETFLCARNANF